ncbi:MAG: prolipoprotein diacylglyceryl transferase [Microbacterium sp.]|jgi:prolipoprotein diacylglyceryl transferase|uniref:Phosphatidylglycerol--prolipoprotein diacylglyceryl transferase n=1 Tax=Microbacterium ginsengisoli TaxID=400772 RepID=A0A0F0LRN0_9MICO|nr:prolipoprotein diacylglyceryl transferase [Microbacterium ginsengisoli]KJL35788.1 Prolipoprotein diacylglyceryl transferase [Microbacterium ginsengisoli]MAL07453.1 prolipoprotein diacylglyceryl transferase [Microbacterium sp.]MBN9208888.1 prolipoprotein diacylglyceryl transferase [Microbacterium ginsengisoli]HAN23656.1 prolipoprotein diacylglyceryl transferase [Microbacterium ginsengisoli]|tara:strand:+ start:498 stop:1454 length:957 start_codon:yes stop_codon:yes gene_type:complete
MSHLSIPSPPPAWAQFSIGPVTIHTYALCIIAGIVVAVLLTEWRLRRRGVAPWTVIDIALWAVPLGIIAARFYHVFTHVGDYFYPGANLWNVFAIWDGGNAIYGSLLGGALGVWIGCRRAGIRFLSFADAMAPGLLAAQAIGRLGNWFNHELFGLPTTLPWGLQIESTNPKFPANLPPGTLFQPLFLYELVWNLIGVAVILLLERRVRLQWGRVLAIYLMWYGFARTFLELIRIDPTSDGLFGIPANSWTSMLAVVAGLVLFVVQTRRHPEPEPSIFTREDAPASRRGGVSPREHDAVDTPSGSSTESHSAPEAGRAS